MWKINAEQDENGVLRPTEDAVTMSCTPALMLTPPNPTSPSDPPFTAASTVSGDVNDVSHAEIITALNPRTESGAAAGTVPLPWLLTSIVGRGEGAGATGLAVIDVGPIGQIGTLDYFAFVIVDV